MTDAQIAVPSTRPEYTPEQVEALVDAYAAAVRHNGRIAGKDAVSAYHEDDEVDADAPRAAVNDAIRTILSALAKAEGDSKRLDWLERTQHSALNWSDISTPSWSIESDATMISGAVGDGKTLREAIDDGMVNLAAMSKERE